MALIERPPSADMVFAALVRERFNLSRSVEE